MKARIISTGEIVEVVDYNDSKATVYRNDETEFFAQNEYSRDEVEFLPDTPDEVTIEGWVARNDFGPRDLGLRVYTIMPERMKNRKQWNGKGEQTYLIDHRLFHSLTWQDEPKKVKITISPI